MGNFLPHLSQWSSKVVRPAASAPPGNATEMRILEPHPGPQSENFQSEVSGSPPGDSAACSGLITSGPGLPFPATLKPETELCGPGWVQEQYAAGPWVNLHSALVTVLCCECRIVKIDYELSGLLMENLENQLSCVYYF